MAGQRKFDLRQEIIAVAGPEGLNPPIENPAEPLWDARIGGPHADVFCDYDPRTHGSARPEKILAEQGIITLRDASMVGASTLITAPWLGSKSILDMWKNMRALEPPMPLLYEPHMDQIVRLSFGDLGRVPLLAAAKRWLPEGIADRFADKHPTVREAAARIRNDTLRDVITDEHGQSRFERDVIGFAAEYVKTKKEQS